MALPWARLDVNIASHDKIVNLLSSETQAALRWQAVASYMFSIGYSVGHGTNGHIPKAALPFVHGTPRTARLLVAYDLWIEATSGWDIKNFALYQELDVISESKRAARTASGRKAACIKWHGKDCGCWKGAANDA
ncbi:hypothetical protein [Nocardioides sp. J54]|uniref:hypothetical protein n=1 Tax=Nocardioides sp. J54 TaxID=935866 RepID=UPI0004AE66A8|nr:hypothetical protein [Nocardioides sp. J54]